MHLLGVNQRCFSRPVSKWQCFNVANWKIHPVLNQHYLSSPTSVPSGVVIHPGLRVWVKCRFSSTAKIGSNIRIYLFKTCTPQSRILPLARCECWKTQHAGNLGPWHRLAPGLRVRIPRGSSCFLAEFVFRIHYRHFVFLCYIHWIYKIAPGRKIRFRLYRIRRSICISIAMVYVNSSGAVYVLSHFRFIY